VNPVYRHLNAYTERDFNLRDPVLAMLQALSKPAFISLYQSAHLRFDTVPGLFKKSHQ
jgi:hypothetical protein